MERFLNYHSNNFGQARKIFESKSDSELIDLLVNPALSKHTELYLHRLPSGLEYVSGPQARNCVDFATGNQGRTKLIFFMLEEARDEKGNLIVYFNNGRNTHAGKVIENGERVISQWDQYGPVFKHGILQIPSMYGTKFNFFKMPSEFVKGI